MALDGYRLDSEAGGLSAQELQLLFHLARLSQESGVPAVPRPDSVVCAEILAGRGLLTPSASADPRHHGTAYTITEKGIDAFNATMLRRQHARNLLCEHCRRVVVRKH
ncbi:MAG: hypothetical protein P4L83_19535 [Nevskia sp.]|nr:hypothetical protein [Nevskia sp.]